jgi:3-phenylpropionate/cinnamic acid dioxygenase small subunit
MSKVDAAEIEQFLYQEAALLDGRQYEEWLSLFTDDAYYWIPAGQDDTDPLQETSLVYDDRRTLGLRVTRLLHPAAHCQTPPSRTASLISNIRVEELDNGEVKVRSNLALFESRLGNQRVFAARVDHTLRRSDGHWRIAYKKVDLINRDAVFSNLTFLL